MKAVDSSIKIGGGPTAWCDSSFLTTFLEDSGSHVDFLDLHFYPGNDTESQLLAAPEALSTDLSDARTLINTYVPGGASSIAIHVGEYNLSWVTSVIDEYGYTGVASVVDADILGRILAVGDNGLAWATKNGPMSTVFGNSAPPIGVFGGHPDAVV